MKFRIVFESWVHDGKGSSGTSSDSLGEVFHKLLLDNFGLQGKKIDDIILEGFAQDCRVTFAKVVDCCSVDLKQWFRRSEGELKIGGADKMVRILEQLNSAGEGFFLFFQLEKLGVCFL